MAILLGVLLLLSGPARVHALWSEEVQQRLNVGVRLFPAVLAADQSLSERSTPQGELRVLVVYRDESAVARETAARLSRLEPIQGLPLRVETVPLAGLEQRAGRGTAGIFLVTPGIPGLHHLVQHLRTLVFSPFVEDVEHGAVAGIHVAERILPYVNLDQARQTGIRFKPFFLRVARPYE